MTKPVTKLVTKPVTKPVTKSEICGFGIGYGIGRNYRPFRVSVSVSGRNQNSGFGRSLLLGLENCFKIHGKYMSLYQDL